MAELSSNTSSDRKPRRGGRRNKKLSTRIDLTPMVDLGFLLITFFIYTTTISEIKAMQIFLPENVLNEDVMKITDSGVLTLIPTGNDSLYYYEGENPAYGTFIAESSARDIIMQKKRSSNPDLFIVVLKPSETSTYKNVVNLLDEMQICAVRHYVMADPQKLELLAMNKK